MTLLWTALGRVRYRHSEFSPSNSLSRARSGTVNSASVPPLTSRYLWSQFRSASGPTPYATATSLIDLEDEITSKHNSSLNSWLNWAAAVISDSGFDGFSYAAVADWM